MATRVITTGVVLLLGIRAFWPDPLQRAPFEATIRSDRLRLSQIDKSCTDM